LEKNVGKFEVLTAVDRKSLGKSTDIVPIKGAGFPKSLELTPHAMIAFYLDPKSKAAALPLADSSPEKGERVWALSKGDKALAGPNPLLAVTVTQVHDDYFVFDYAEGTDAEPLVGAVLVNFAGEIVGMHTSFAGQHTAYAMRVEHIRENLAAAIDKK
jgi:hypothetical protein